MFTLTMPAEIRTERLLLRPMQEGDVASFVDAVRASANEIGRWMSFAHAAYSADDARTWLTSCREARAKGSGYDYVIELDGALVGGIVVNPLNAIHRMANLAYWVRTSAAGRGIASEAIRAVARTALATGLVRIEVVADVANVASIRAAERAGAVREATLRKRVFMHGVARDAAMLSFVAD